jgi:hypothetical protein
MNFNRKKTKAEILREQYMLEFKTMTTYTNGVRINETLVGRLHSYRETIQTESSCKPRVQSSTTRPVDFGNDITAWLDAVRVEALKLIRGNKSPLRKIAA